MWKKDRKTILVLDDKESDRVAVRKHLELDGYNVVEASTEEEATQKFNEHRPDLAIVDVRLREGTAIPDFSGIRWTTTLPENFPVIVLSSHKEPDVVREALAHRKNVVTFIHKLESIDNLRANVRTALLEPTFKPKPAMWLRVSLVVFFAALSSILCYYYLGDFILALLAAIVVGGLVEVVRLFF